MLPAQGAFIFLDGTISSLNTRAAQLPAPTGLVQPEVLILLTSDSSDPSGDFD